MRSAVCGPFAAYRYMTEMVPSGMRTEQPGMNDDLIREVERFLPSDFKNLAFSRGLRTLSAAKGGCPLDELALRLDGRPLSFS
jgi:hypothetical protein